MIAKLYEAGYNYRSGSQIRYNILTECHKCGQVFSGKVYCNGTTWEEISKVARTKISSCHICNSRILQKEEYSVWDTEGTATTLKKQLQEKTAMVVAGDAQADIAKQVAKIKSIADMPVKNEISEKVKADIPSLKAYIQQVIDIEIWERFLGEHIALLTVEKNTIDKTKKHQKAQDEKSAKTKMEAKEKGFLEEIEKLKRKFKSTDWVGEVERAKITAPAKPKYLKEEEPQKPTPPILKTPNFFNKKRVLAENERLQQEYEKDCRIYEQKLIALETIKSQNELLRQAYKEDMEEYKRKLAAEDERIAQEMERLESEAVVKKEKAKKELDEKIEEIKGKIEKLKNSVESDSEDGYVEIILKKKKDESLKLLKTLHELCGKLFSINVIYPNYRDIFALSSFYEYFNSERCYELEGPDGAYNLYESERRSDSFSTFFRTLEDINKNQVVLYRETSVMFKNLKSLGDSLKKAIKAVDDESSEKAVNEAFNKYFENYDKFMQKIKTAIDDANKILE